MHPNGRKYGPWPSCKPFVLQHDSVDSNSTYIRHANSVVRLYMPEHIVHKNMYLQWKQHAGVYLLLSYIDFVHIVFITHCKYVWIYQKCHFMALLHNTLIRYHPLRSMPVCFTEWCFFCITTLQRFDSVMLSWYLREGWLNLKRVSSSIF